MIDEFGFREILQESLLPMLSGTELGSTKTSSEHHALVAYENPCSLFMKPSVKSTFRVRLRRSQAFTPEEKRLVGILIDELAEVVPQVETSYFRDLLAFLPRRLISRFLPGERGRRSVEEAIRQFEILASQTYEGRPVVAALGLTGSIGYGALRLDELWKEDFSRVLSNGFDSMYVCGSDGRVFNLAFLPYPPSVEFAPHRLGSIAAWCDKAQRVALVLNRNGEVLVFNDRKLRFARRRGAWRYYAHESVVSRLGVGNKALRRAVYESCLDVSFARSGGCVAVLGANIGAKVKKVLSENDLINKKGNPRTQLLACAIRRPFQHLDRRLRQELLSMDGATVLKNTGEVITAGSIVRVPGGSTAGGRRAAALQLSGLGLGIKISADGPITGFRAGKEIFAL